MERWALARQGKGWPEFFAMLARGHHAQDRNSRRRLSDQVSRYGRQLGLRHSFRRDRELNAVIFQLTWMILPGLRGLSCSDFRAVPTAAPDNERGVAIECASE